MNKLKTKIIELRDKMHSIQRDIQRHNSLCVYCFEKDIRTHADVTRYDKYKTPVRLCNECNRR